MKSNRVFSFFLAVLPLSLLVSCAKEPAPSTQDKKAELCTNLARFKTSVATLKSMSPSSTVGDFRKAQDQVKTAFDTLKTSAAAVQDAKTADLEAAYNTLAKAVAAVPNTSTLSQAAASIAPNLAAVEAAEDQIKSGLNCP
jgi:uncharacterized protein YPO0396